MTRRNGKIVVKEGTKRNVLRKKRGIKTVVKRLTGEKRGTQRGKADVPCGSAAGQQERDS